MKYCLISRRVLDTPVGLGLLFRERPFGAQDSGWRFFAGDEEGAYVADARNILMVRLADVLAQHPEVESLLNAPIGSAFERNATGGFVPGV